MLKNIRLLLLAVRVGLTHTCKTTCVSTVNETYAYSRWCKRNENYLLCAKRYYLYGGWLYGFSYSDTRLIALHTMQSVRANRSLHSYEMAILNHILQNSTFFIYSTERINSTNGYSFVSFRE